MLQLNQLKSDDYTIIEVNGRLDTSSYSQLEEKINEVMNAHEKNIVIDLENMEYVSSSGLRVFLMTLKRMKAVGGKFHLCNLRTNVKEIFEIAGFSSIFSIFESKEKAINGL